jgi:tripartite-type tricarboxylate transporter receptor subunit TctC
MKVLSRVCVTLAGCALACSAWAWADRSLRLIVPAPPGGTADIVARIAGNQLATEIGQPVVVENRPGAGGGIGMKAMLNAPADGNTLVVAASNVLAETPQVMKMPFDPLKDVIPVASLTRSAWSS